MAANVIISWRFWVCVCVCVLRYWQSVDRHLNFLFVCFFLKIVLFALTGFLSLEIILEHSNKRARERLHGQDHAVWPLYLGSTCLLRARRDLADDKHGDGDGDVEDDEGRWGGFFFFFLVFAVVLCAWLASGTVAGDLPASSHCTLTSACVGEVPSPFPPRRSGIIGTETVSPSRVQASERRAEIRTRVGLAPEPASLS